MERIGIYGGTFNPIHKGHIYLAKQVAEAFRFDRMLFIPDNLPPHKIAPDLASGEDRLHMVKLAVKEIPGAEVSDIELKADGKSYTIWTLEKLRVLYPEAEFYLIMGADMLLTFTQWFRWQDILKEAHLIAAARSDGEYRELKEMAEKLGNVTVLAIKPLPMSSSEIREKLKNGEEMTDFLPEPVADYVKEKGLYR